MFRFWTTLVLLLSFALCFAQATGTLVGRVKNAESYPMDNVDVSILKGDKIIASTQSTASGYYIIRNIPPGKYSVRFSQSGYLTKTFTNVIIAGYSTTTCDATMPNSKRSKKEVSHPTGEAKVDKGNMSHSLPQAEITMSAPSAERASDMAMKMMSPSIGSGGANYSKFTLGDISASEQYKRSNGPIPRDEWWDCRYIQNYIPPTPQHYNTEDYASVVENPYKYSIAEPLSTFSIDVDTAGYTNVRRLINEGSLPQKDYVRIEELLNYFDYNYPQPRDQHPFAVFTEMAACPWNTSHKLLHIGLQGKNIDYRKAPPSNLVFLLDVSGSMSDFNKLRLVKESMALLVKQLRPQDRVAIVTYASTTSVALKSTSGRHKSTILEAIDQLYAGGSTAGGAGLKLAYKVAQENMARGGNNRIILCTDGDFNVGESSDNAMEKLISDKRQAGVFLTVLGFGMGNIKDSKMEILADKGNGNYGYIDNLIEAQRMLVKEMGGTLFTIAKDVKLQLEFNPAEVKAYRLIGYENRALKAEDFNNDRIDAGELGAGHQVTALYELIMAGSDESAEGIDPLKYQKVKLTDQATHNNELLTIKLRYKKPNSNTSIRMERIVRIVTMLRRGHSENFRFSAAVAGFGLLLRDSQYQGHLSWDQVIELACGAVGKDPDGYRREFITLCEQTRDLMQGHPHRYPMGERD